MLKPNGESMTTTTTNALQNQITAGLKEIFMNKVDCLPLPLLIMSWLGT